MFSSKPMIFNLLVVVAMLLAVVGIAPAGAGTPRSTAAPASLAAQPTQPDAAGPTSIETASDKALSKFSDTLVNLANTGGDSMVEVRILTTAKAFTWPAYAKFVPLAQPDELTGLKVWYGKVKASELAKLASLDFVVYGESLNVDNVVPRFKDPDQVRTTVTDEMRARLKALRDHPPAAPAKPNAPSGWWDIGPGHESSLAWAKGYTGSGVTVADIDSGVDFCHPDLYGTWKTYNVASSRNITYNVYTEYPYQLVSVPNYYSYYNGWPEMLSPVSNYLLFFDLYFNGAPTDLNTFAYGISKFADTRATGTGSTISFDGKVYTTTGTASIFNPIYHIGYHPDTSLENLWWGERIGVLVVDEDGDGVYDTVYVDLNDNHDFSDDKPANQSDPSACWDADGDGKNDLSGGLVYFIADGKHFPAMMDWWWGPTTYSLPAPGAGELVAFMFDDVLGPAAAHGTLTAGNIVGQGVADGDPSVYGGVPRPVWKPAGVGGMVQGGGKNAKLIAIGDSYWNFTASTEEAWYFASMGVDGYGDTNDGAQITSNSYGESAVDNDEWDNRSRLMTRLNTRTTYRSFPAIYNQQVAHLVSTGNGAPGYGTVTAADASTAIHVGASTQFGSTADFDSISGADQIVWGDVIPWSNRGPTAVGHLAPSVTGDGAFAAGDITLNGAFGDGNAAWESWGGTSRSAPVAAGNLALIYDAYKQRFGTYPTWQQAKELIMNGASDQKSDVLVQGAGAVNADLATDIAGGRYGLNVSPAEWYPGSYRGNEYLAFSQIITPGGTDSQVFTLNNFGPLTTTANLTATYLTKISSNEFTATLSTANESPYAFTRPDYLWNVSQYAPSGIPAGTDLMVAEVIQPFNEFASGNSQLPNDWRILWYSAKDVNGNGRLWQDANGNGAVNAGEIDSGEYIRFAYGYNYSTYHQVSVKDPLTRWKDGIYLGLQHRNRSGSAPTTHLTFRITYFKKTAWPWLTFNTPSVTVNPTSTATVTATASVPALTPYGAYEGAIEVSLPANGNYGARTTIVPVVLSVAFSGDATAAPIQFGGTPATNTRLDNGSVNGSQDWSWRPESGDWRFFFLDQTTTPAAGSRLVVKDQWADPAPETDIDTLVLGPSNTPYTRVQAPFSFNFGDFSAADPATFGPYRLEVSAKSANRNVGAGIWTFQTTTGSNTEYVVAPLANGLNEVLQHSVRYQGDKFAVPFTKTVSTLTGPTALAYTNFFTDIVRFSSNITYTGGLTVSAYGMAGTQQTINSTIEQDPTNGNYCDFAAGGIYTYTFTMPANVSSYTAHVNVGSNDLDLFLLRDVNGNGTISCPSEVIASSTNSAGTDDEVNVSFPPAGNYMVVIQGWSVNPSPTPFSWYWRRTDLDNSIAMRNADLTIGPFKDAMFELYNVNPTACNDVTADCNDGIIYVGFPDAPRLLSIPVTVNYAGPDLSTSSKTVNAATAKVGDVLTYTVNLINSSFTYTATNARLTDTLPSGVTFGGLVAGGATYSPTLNAVLWNGNIDTAVMGNVVTTTNAFTDVSSVGISLTWPSGDDDEGHVQVALPWAFPWFGNDYTSVWVDANGELCFGGACSGGGATYNDDNRIPSANVPNNRIAAFYEDLTGPITGNAFGCPGADAVYKYNDVVNSRFIVEYRNWCSFNDGGLNTFEVMLYPNGKVEIHYQNVPSAPPNLTAGSFPGVSPAGLENAAGTIGYKWAGSVVTSTAWMGQSDNPGKQTIVYTVTVNANVPNGTVIANTADTNNGLGNVRTTAAANTIINAVNLATSSKSVDKAVAAVNDTLMYAVTTENTGVVTATNAMMTDTLPAHTMFISQTGASQLVLQANLSGLNEVPPVTTTNGTGQLTFYFDPSTNRLTYSGQVSGLEANVIAAHIHTGTVGVNGPILTPFTYVTTTHGATFSGVYTVPAASVTALLSEGLYANVHTSAHGGGEVRGQIKVTGVGWNGELGVGASHDTNIWVKVLGPLANGTAIDNEATVDDGFGTTWTTNMVSTEIKTPDLSQSAKSANTTHVKSGDRITYTLFIRNTGFANASAMMVDQLPASLTLTGTPTIVSGPGALVVAGNTVTWTGTLEYLYNNTQSTVLVSAVVGPLGICQSIANTATVYDGTGNSYPASVTINGPCYRIFLPVVRK